MTTVVIQIGNSDNKLTQEEWSVYVARVMQAIAGSDSEIHFSGGSGTERPWQNWCVVFVPGADFYSLLVELEQIRKDFRQDSIALTQGHTTFI